MTRVGVIGAGAAGICAARHLASNPNVTSFTVFERQGSIGGTWVYTDKIGDPDESSPMYKSLVTNLPDRCMQFADFDFHTLPDKAQCVSHTRVLKYLRDYAAHFDVEKYIKFKRRVEEVKFVEHTGVWTVTTRMVGAEETVEVEEFDKIIFANGHYAVPSYGGLGSYESLSAKFNGTILHSGSYREPAQIGKGKKVVIVGGAASALDIAIELKNHCSITIAGRNESPESQMLGKLLDIPLCSGVKEIDRDGLVLGDGSRVHADVLLFATGYAYDFTILKTEPPGMFSACNEYVQDLYYHIFPKQLWTKVALIGVHYKLRPFPYIDHQIRFVLSAWFDKIPEITTEKMSTWLEEQNAIKSDWPKRYTHHFRGDANSQDSPYGYMEEVERLAGGFGEQVKQAREISKFFYIALWEKLRKSEPLTYKEKLLDLPSQ